MHPRSLVLTLAALFASGGCATTDRRLAADLGAIESLRVRLARRDVPPDLAAIRGGCCLIDEHPDAGCLSVGQLVAWLQSENGFDRSWVTPHAIDGEPRNDVVRACLEAERTGFAVLLRDELIALARDPRASRQARVQAVQALAVSNDPAVERALLSLLDDDVAGHQAMVQIGRRPVSQGGRVRVRNALPSPRAAWLMHRWAAQWESADVRALVAMLDGPAASEALAVLLRGRTAQAGRIESALVAVAATQPLSLHAFAWIAYQRAVPPALLDHVEAAAASAERDRREVALQALGAVGGAKGTATLLAIVERGEPAGDVGAAILGLARGDTTVDTWGRVLAKVASSGERGWKRAALDRMFGAGLAAPQFLPVLERLARDRDLATSIAARHLLARIRDAAAAR